MEYCFHLQNTMAYVGAQRSLIRMIPSRSHAPVIVCIGSDLAIGDSLGPIVGTLLKERGEAQGAFIYGTLKTPVTAKEIGYLNGFLMRTHPGCPIIAVDAAVGDESEIGLIKISDHALQPGAGANKRLNKVGDCSILGIVADKENFSYSKLNLTRLGIVYRMAEVIAGAICGFLSEFGTLRAAE